MPAHFEDIQIGAVEPLGTAVVDAGHLDGFVKAYAPGWPPDQGAPDAMVYAIWSRLDHTAAKDWPSSSAWAWTPFAGCAIRRRASCCGAA